MGKATVPIDTTDIDDDLETVIEKIEAIRTKLDEANRENDEQADRLDKADKIADRLLEMDARKQWDFQGLMDLVRAYKGVP